MIFLKGLVSTLIVTLVILLAGVAYIRFGIPPQTATGLEGVR